MMKLADEIAKNIKKFRLERGLTQAALADLVGVSRATMNRWEDGETAKMAVENISLLAEKLDVSEKDLLGVEPAPRAAVPDLSVQLSPELYDLLFRVRSLNPTDRDFVFQFVASRSSRAVAGDKAKTGT